jgi:hypothetical protein
VTLLDLPPDVRVTPTRWINPPNRPNPGSDPIRNSEIPNTGIFEIYVRSDRLLPTSFPTVVQVCHLFMVLYSLHLTGASGRLPRRGYHRDIATHNILIYYACQAENPEAFGKRHTYRCSAG